ncbi:MAG: tRNA glutamyl-Q(34) synthetase GluQRS [Rubrivivax sp.]|jgi:glutamyl-Q tRNA(Asp) synthetase
MPEIDALRPVGASARYVGRFAPSPTGPLHAGSLVAALASWLDARAHGGRWLVRIEDVDGPRCVPGADRLILGQLERCGLRSDGQVLWQSTRGAAYAQALDGLRAAGHAYDCGCSRRDIEAALAAQGVALSRNVERPYPGTCRHGLDGKAPRAVRLRTLAADGSHEVIAWTDRRLGPQKQDVTAQVGDFVLRRADGLWAYQLAVVVDDAAQGVTDVVRGEDLADNTPRQILLQRRLGLPAPRTLHTPLVRGDNGEKLSKQNGAAPLDLSVPLRALAAAAEALGLPGDLDGDRDSDPGRGGTVAEWLGRQVRRWHDRWVLSPYRSSRSSRSFTDPAS